MPHRLVYEPNFLVVQLNTREKIYSVSDVQWVPVSIDEYNKVALSSIACIEGPRFYGPCRIRAADYIV
jgi:hypothetical protein